MKLVKALLALPTLFTLSSVFLGFLSSIFVLDGEHRLAATAILFAALFDALDGKVARLTRTESRFGIQIDSLADVMSFGLAPAVLIYGAALRGLSGGAVDLVEAAEALGEPRRAQLAYSAGLSMTKGPRPWRPGASGKTCHWLPAPG